MFDGEYKCLYFANIIARSMLFCVKGSRHWESVEDQPVLCNFANNFFSFQVLPSRPQRVRACVPEDTASCSSTPPAEAHPLFSHPDLTRSTDLQLHAGTLRLCRDRVQPLPITGHRTGYVAIRVRFGTSLNKNLNLIWRDIT